MDYGRAAHLLHRSSSISVQWLHAGGQVPRGRRDSEVQAWQKLVGDRTAKSHLSEVRR